MTSTLNSSTSYYMNPMMHQYRKRVLLKRSTQQINDPHVVQQMKLASIKQKPKKSVKFGEELEQVRYFYKSQASTSVKMDPPFMDTSADDYKLSLPNWPTRNSIFYNTDQKIRMESAQLVDGDIQHMSNNKVVIEGRCRALNISFHKVVSVRYTFDLWRTYEETTAEFRESIPSTSNTWDRFSFYIPIDADKRNTQSLCFALRYTVGDIEYWDNNHSANYEMIVTPDLQEEQEEEEQYDEQDNVVELALTQKKNDNTKVLASRYDFTASLTAARKPFSPPPSPPGTPDDNGNFTYTPPVFFNDSHQVFDTTPVYQIVPTQQQQVKKSYPPSPTEPVTPPDSPPLSAEGFQMSYSDFVKKYCFYNSNPIYSTSPSAVLS